MYSLPPSYEAIGYKVGEMVGNDGDQLPTTVDVCCGAQAVIYQRKEEDQMEPVHLFQH